MCALSFFGLCFNLYLQENQTKLSIILILLQTIGDGKEQTGSKTKVIFKSSSMLIVGVALVSGKIICHFSTHIFAPLLQ